MHRVGTALSPDVVDYAKVHNAILFGGRGGVVDVIQALYWWIIEVDQGEEL